MSEKLKPCPFCGGEARMKEYTEWCGGSGVKYYYVACSSLQHQIEIENCNSEQDAISSWNTRWFDDSTIQSAAEKIIRYKRAFPLNETDADDISAIIKRHLTGGEK